jgi:hypothetical protein
MNLPQIHSFPSQKQLAYRKTEPRQKISPFVKQQLPKNFIDIKDKIDSTPPRATRAISFKIDKPKIEKNNEMSFQEKTQTFDIQRTKKVKKHINPFERTSIISSYDEKKEFDMIKHQAREGNIDSMLQLGRELEYGIIEEQNLFGALKCFLNAT